MLSSTLLLTDALSEVPREPSPEEEVAHSRWSAIDDEGDDEIGAVLCLIACFHSERVILLFEVRKALREPHPGGSRCPEIALQIGASGVSARRPNTPRDAGLDRSHGAVSRGRESSRGAEKAHQRRGAVHDDRQPLAPVTAGFAVSPRGSDRIGPSGASVPSSFPSHGRMKAHLERFGARKCFDRICRRIGHRERHLSGAQKAETDAGLLSPAVAVRREERGDGLEVAQEIDASLE
jgi:hypothetical protein